MTVAAETFARDVGEAYPHCCDQHKQIALVTSELRRAVQVAQNDQQAAHKQKRDASQLFPDDFLLEKEQGKQERPLCLYLQYNAARYDPRPGPAANEANPR